MAFALESQMRVWRHLLMISLFCLSTLICFVDTDAAERPNIIVIMTDDMGYSDLGCYGGEIPTPEIDRLATGGIRFSQFYNTGRCCPTRASLLTGLYPHQAGIGDMMGDRGYDGYRGLLNNHCVTIAEVLKEAGYGTYHTGKWHLSRFMRQDGPKLSWPLQRGFDRFYGIIHGGGSQYDPVTLTRDNRFISPYNDPEYQPESYYFTDAISDQSVRFIREHQQRTPDRPFFLYVAYTAPHWPIQAAEEEIQRFREIYKQGFEAIRKNRDQRVRELGLISSDWKLPPSEDHWNDVANQEWEANNMAVYAAMISIIDRGVGRIISSLQEKGQFENTIIFFLHDNGASAEQMGRAANSNRPAGPREPHPQRPLMPKEALQTNIIPVQSRQGYLVRQGPDVQAGPDDTYIAYGKGWANVSNTPFREYKHFVHEGGISSPLVIHWPAAIQSPGRIVHDPSHLIDLMATCVDVAGASYPTEWSGHPIKPMEGMSLVPALQGKSLPIRMLYWEHGGNRAVRHGDWKLVAKKEAPWELYDLKSDRTELADLSAVHPDRVQHLMKLWQDWAERANVLPLNPWPVGHPNHRAKTQ